MGRQKDDRKHVCIARMEWGHPAESIQHLLLVHAVKSTDLVVFPFLSLAQPSGAR